MAPKVWISPGKHASYLNQTLCQGGCGADKCANMVALAPGKLINLGEIGQPMNGSLFISSSAWPLADKMANTNFPAGPVARLNQLPESDIAWFNAGRHPAQGVIAVSSSTEQAIARAGKTRPQQSRLRAIPPTPLFRPRETLRAMHCRRAIETLSTLSERLPGTWGKHSM